MKKLNFIVGKKQLVVVAVLLILGVAAFLNWQFTPGDQAVTVMDVGDRTEDEKDKEKDKEEKDSSKNGQTYGEAELVNKNETNKKKGSNFIKQAKIDREKAFDEAIDNNNKLLQSTNLSQEDITKITNQSIQLKEKKDQQTAIEDAIKGKKLATDSIAYIEEGKINVMVQTKNLDDQKVAKIKDIVTGITKSSASNIVITPVKD